MNSKEEEEKEREEKKIHVYMWLRVVFENEGKDQLDILCTTVMYTSKYDLAGMISNLFSTIQTVSL